MDGKKKDGDELKANRSLNFLKIRNIMHRDFSYFVK